MAEQLQSPQHTLQINRNLRMKMSVLAGGHRGVFLRELTSSRGVFLRELTSLTSFGSNLIILVGRALEENVLLQALLRASGSTEKE